MSSSFTRPCLLAIAAAIVSALLFAVPKAHAGLLVQSAQSCDNEQLSQPFAPWRDQSDYFQLDNGGFENGTSGWTVSDGASVVSGNEPWNVAGASDDSSLVLSPGATATSPTACVGLDSPTLRFFARHDGGILSPALLKVDALVEDNFGNTDDVPVFATVAGSSWSPTVTMPVTAALLPLLPGDHTPVAFKFTALGPGDWQIDDAYVDPWHCC